MLGPMGSGALVAKPELLEAMPPYHGGGEMISRVWDDHSTYNKIPHKFEAGTPNVEAAGRPPGGDTKPQRNGGGRAAGAQQAPPGAGNDHTTHKEGREGGGPAG